MDCTKL